MGSFPSINVCFYWLAWISEIDNRSRLRQEFNVSVSLWKKRDCVRVCSFAVGVFVCVRHNQSGYLTFRTTKVKDTKLILAVIPF